VAHKSPYSVLHNICHLPGDQRGAEVRSQPALLATFWRRLRTSGTQVAHKWHTSGIQVAHKWHTSGTQVAHKWHTSGIQVAHKWHTSGTQVAHKWHTSGTQVAHKWHTSGIQVAYKWRTSGNICHLPGDQRGAEVRSQPALLATFWRRLRTSGTQVAHKWHTSGIQVAYKWRTSGNICHLPGDQRGAEVRRCPSLAHVRDLLAVCAGVVRGAAPLKERALHARKHAPQERLLQRPLVVGAVRVHPALCVTLGGGCRSQEKETVKGGLGDPKEGPS
jgi:hypothetical protein